MHGPAGPLLAVIDMQRVFGEPGSDWFAPRFGRIVGPIRRLVDAFRPRVIFTRFIAPETPAGAWRQYYGQWPFALQPPGARIYELVDEFAAEPGPTLDATTFSKWGTGAGRLVAGGAATAMPSWCSPGSPPTAACCPRRSPPPMPASRSGWWPTPAPASTT